jgi:RNA polymerase sigma-70 factor, ECF subfamily
VTEQDQRLIFEQWLDRHRGLIFKIVRAYAHSVMDQDDLFQEITVQVWRSIPAFRNESAATTWIYRVALNTAMRWLRKERKHPQAEELDRAQHVLQENQVHEDEQLAWLYEEIRKLNEIDRSITLLMLDGLSYKEMAAIIGITETHIGVKINRIKKHLISKSKKYDHHGI